MRFELRTASPCCIGHHRTAHPTTGLRCWQQTTSTHGCSEQFSEHLEWQPAWTLLTPRTSQSHLEVTSRIIKCVWDRTERIQCVWASVRQKNWQNTICVCACVRYKNWENTMCVFVCVRVRVPVTCARLPKEMLSVMTEGRWPGTRVKCQAGGHESRQCRHQLMKE